MTLSVKEIAGGHASQLTLQLKTKITIARDFMEESAIHLKASERFLNGIEGEPASSSIHNGSFITLTRTRGKK